MGIVGIDGGIVGEGDGGEHEAGGEDDFSDQRVPSHSGFSMNGEITR
jgi:hypothetical protein